MPTISREIERKPPRICLLVLPCPVYRNRGRLFLLSTPSPSHIYPPPRTPTPLPSSFRRVHHDGSPTSSEVRNIRLIFLDTIFLLLACAALTAPRIVLSLRVSDGPPPCFRVLRYAETKHISFFLCLGSPLPRPFVRCRRRPRLTPKPHPRPQ